LLNLFTFAIRDGTNINIIRKWSIWGNYQEFLTYRYHQVVLAAEKRKSIKQKTPSMERENKENQLKEVEDILKHFLDNEIEITIKNVCSELKVSP